MHHVLALRWTAPVPATAHAEEHVEDVHGRVEVTLHSAFLDGLLATPVVQVPLFGVGKDLISLGDGFELQGWR